MVVNVMSSLICFCSFINSGKHPRANLISIGKGLDEDDVIDDYDNKEGSHLQNNNYLRNRENETITLKINR